MKYQTKNRGVIVGRVTTIPVGKPIVNATVMISGNSPPHKDIAAITNELGVYSFDDLIPGNYTIMVNTEVHGTQTQQTYLEKGHVIRLDFMLTD